MHIFGMGYQLIGSIWYCSLWVLLSSYTMLLHVVEVPRSKERAKRLSSEGGEMDELPSQSWC